MFKTIRHIGVQGWRLVRRLTGSADALVLTRPPWRQRLARWSISLVALGIAFQFYALLVVPWIEPAARTRAAITAVSASGATGGHPELDALFPADAWERSRDPRPKLLETRGGKLLFLNYERLSDGRLELRPCTMIVDAPAGKDGRRPIVLQSEKGALLVFAGAFDPARAQFSPLKTARLSGEVTIFSPATAADADDALRIITRNVQVSPTQIWTPADVAFRYGPHHGSGRDLSIALTEPHEAAAGGKSGSRFGDLKLLELVHVDKLVAQMPAHESPGSRAPVVPSEVEVTCQGPFQFDFQRGVAVFERQVALIRSLPSGLIDRLHGDRMQIFFRVPTEASPLRPTSAGSLSSDASLASQPSPAVAAAPTSLSDRTPPLPSTLEAQRIVLLGSPARLDAPSFQAAAEGQRLVYDLESREIELKSDQRVLLTYGPHFVESRWLRYRLPADPRRLGQLSADGPGVYRGRFGRQQEQEVTANWCGLLQLQPQNDMHLLSATEGGQITLGPDEQFSADRIDLWLEEIEDTATSPPPGPELIAPAQDLRRLPVVESAPSAETSAPAPVAYRIRPVKLQAVGNVDVRSEQFQGRTGRLEAWFEEPVAEPGLTDGPALPGLAGARSAGGVTEADSATPPAAGPRVPTVGPRADQPPMRRLELSGDWVRLNLLLAKPQPKVREATVTGNVRLAQFATRTDTDPQMLVTGHELQVRVDPWERATVDVAGGEVENSAQVYAKGVWMCGANLHVSQIQNRMWADGPGQMKLPGRQATVARQLGGSSPVWIAWLGGMNFDGQQVRFQRDVELRTIHVADNGDRLHVKSRGAELQANLNRYLAFAHASALPPDIDVTELRFLGNVTTENITFDSQGRQISRDEMALHDMVLDRPTGRFHGAGPGWLTSTRYGRPEAGVPGEPASTARASAASEQLNYLQINFENEVVGNVNTRELELRYQVRAVYGPIASWGQTLDPTQPGGLGPRGLVMTCHRLNVVDMGLGGRGSLEMNAIGDTVVEGTQFIARGDRLSYSQAKALLVLEGEGYNFAKLEYRQVPGRTTSASEARKIFYWVRTGQFEVKDVRSGQFMQYGPATTPPARLP